MVGTWNSSVLSLVAWPKTGTSSWEASLIGVGPTLINCRPVLTVIVLELLGVHDDYQKKGIGAMLVKWGTDHADSDGLDTYLDGSEIGQPFYKKHVRLTNGRTNKTSHPLTCRFAVRFQARRCCSGPRQAAIWQLPLQQHRSAACREVAAKIRKEQIAYADAGSVSGYKFAVRKFDFHMERGTA